MSSLGIGLGRPSGPAVNQPSSGLRTTSRNTRHPKREASGGAFQMFTPPQIKQFREAFTLLDADGDGKITEQDLITAFGNLGQTPSRKLLDSLLAHPGGSTTTTTGTTVRTINFTQFLTLFGQHLLELADSEQEILEAFACFDEHDEGFVDVGGVGPVKGAGYGAAESTKIGQEGLRGWLRDYGDKMSEAEASSPLAPITKHVASTDPPCGTYQLDRFFTGPFMDKKRGKFDYVRFAKTLKVNDAAEVEQQQQR
ncbi:hypothetical protein QFC19_008008 [Naganishia cerealis]|uniref:Uncharacterized protein n=1 Tax=Naganishia cerealis TaxID=610337 RepID=A0ACC2V6W6_9TREE|nr:hypothetical protein QFC19_008008 [Naganishia cerealis]